MGLRLCTSRFGRVLLHVACAARDRHVRWHLRGVVRELSPGRERTSRRGGNRAAALPAAI